MGFISLPSFSGLPVFYIPVKFDVNLIIKMFSFITVLMDIIWVGKDFVFNYTSQTEKTKTHKMKDMYVYLCIDTHTHIYMCVCVCVFFLHFLFYDLSFLWQSSGRPKLTLC